MYVFAYIWLDQIPRNAEKVRKSNAEIFAKVAADFCECYDWVEAKK